MRRTDGCMNCGEVREIAAHGLCFKCYRQNDRARDREAAQPDRHNPGIHREQKKMFRGFAGVMGGLSDLGVTSEDVLAIRRILDPYLAMIARFLAPTKEQEVPQDGVHGEQKPGTQLAIQTEQELKREQKTMELFTVHTNAEPK